MQNICNIVYKQDLTNNALPFKGIQFKTPETYDNYLRDKVVPKLLDISYRKSQIDNIKESLYITGFDSINIESALNKIFEPNFVIENWLIGEFVAEEILEDIYKIKFFYNHLRDAKNPNAKQTGTDIVGFSEIEDGYCFVFGEVKTSNNPKTPPASVTKRNDGMRDQLKTLAKQEKNIIYNLIQYMHNKMFNASKECREIFISALSNYLKDCTNIKLYGCLVRDTNPNPQDLSSSAKNLYAHIKGLTQAEFVAIYTGSKMQDEHWINIVKEVSNASKQ